MTQFASQKQPNPTNAVYLFSFKIYTLLIIKKNFKFNPKTLWVVDSNIPAIIWAIPPIKNPKPITNELALNA